MATSAPEPTLFTPAFVRLTAAHFLQSMGFASMLLLPAYLDYLHATRAEIGGIMAAAAAGGLVTRPAVGPLLDRWGRKPTLIAGTVALSTGMIMLGAVTQVGWWVVVARLMVGVGLGAVFTGYFTLASDLIPESRRTEGLALFGVAGLIPLLLQPMVSRMGVDAPAVRWFLPAVGATILLSIVLLAGLRVRRPSGGQPRLSVRGLARLLRARALWSVWFADVAFSGLVATFMAFSLVVAAQRGMAHAADVWFAYGMGAVGVRVVGARLPDRWGGSRVLGAALLAYLLGVWCLADAQSVAQLWVAGILAGLGHGYCFPILTAQVVTRSPQAIRGSALSMFTGVWDVSKLMVPPLLGLVGDGWGDATMLRVAAGVGAVAWLVWLYLEWGSGVDVLSRSPSES